METSVNNKCRAFTSLEQSKKLAEILPLESADMWWLYITAQGKYIAMMHEEPDPHYLARMESYGIKDAAIRCWSLSALLGVLPNNVNISTNLSKGGYKISTLEYTNSWFVDYEDETNGLNNCVTSADNPVDACYEMIIKLNELNLL